MLRVFERLCERLNNSPGADSIVIIKLVLGTRLAKFIHSQANGFSPKDTTDAERAREWPSITVTTGTCRSVTGIKRSSPHFQFEIVEATLD